MRIGIPKEIKKGENRVSLIPSGARRLVESGHSVYVEKNAGEGSGFSDEDYAKAGAFIVSAEEAWNCELIVKVKEPQPSEYRYLKKNLLLFAFLHLAANRELTMVLLEREVISFAYETLRLPDGSLPLLIPMSEIAGRVAIQHGARILEKNQGGMGILLGGVPGVEPARVAIIGGGTVGTNAMKMALGLGAEITVFDCDLKKLRYLDDLLGGRIKTVMANPYAIEERIQSFDLLIGAVLNPGAKSPKVITKQMIQKMKPGSAVMDISIDQGGCIETIDNPTTLDNPTFIKDGVIHYAVANIPASVPKTATAALTNATFYWIDLLANHGLEAVQFNPSIKTAINTIYGELTCRAVAEAFGIPWSPIEKFL
ncbi:alanine dehydrogenase [Candidatus Methylacidiphilum infernorum]|uniref:Alanine dehydrogenase n=1 Tax=Candidatus Methylacidiphilum infernorum TaxID=511746 RepID=A0ABX7PX86_9BACT|nr:alanine dehydrogenase [Candidatus Methylacidiphilum infernorum]QSR87271.1 alanine dehydrogenase [Candidatus Methylacidiphilum infernorum]